MRGVFSYGGKPIRSWQDGAWVDAYGWLDLCRHEFPLPLGKRSVGSCDVPDLELFPRRYPTVRTVSFQAGFASDLGHLVVWGLAGLVRAGIVRDMAVFARPLNRLSRWMEPIVSDKGGMFVTLEGEGTDGEPLGINWDLIARTITVRTFRAGQQSPSKKDRLGGVAANRGDAVHGAADGGRVP